MKTLLAAATLVVASLASLPLAANPYPRGIDARQHAQERRIDAGVAGGQLTRCEAARLDRRGDRIERREHAYRATGGLQPRERHDLNHRLDSVSRDIREQRRDGNGCF
jgi:opacity protein-like surface antigen